MRLNIHTLFDGHKPLLTSIYSKERDKLEIIPLHHPKNDLTIAEVWKNEETIKKVIEKTLARGGRVVLSDFKSHVKAFNIDLSSSVEVYDAVLPDKLHERGSSLEISEQTAIQVVKHLSRIKTKSWQRLYANAGIVYQKLEDNGVLVAGRPCHPQWSQKVFSGRSKTTGFNIQGATDDYDIRCPAAGHDDVFICFDWKAADIRIAALLSNDEKLLGLSYHDDPYIAISKELGILKRSQAKVALLRAINSMDIDSRAVQIFPNLVRWIRNCRKTLKENGKLMSILDRQFDLTLAQGRKNPTRSVFNATMQGSIAHAMHSCVKQMWDAIGPRLVCEMHDCIVITSPNDKKYLTKNIRSAVDIIRNPFSGLVDTNPVFPVRVSIGRHWRKWKELRVFS